MSDASFVVRMRLTREQAQKLRVLRECYEQDLNDKLLAAHLRAKGTKKGFSRRHVSLCYVVSQAVDYFLTICDQE